MEKTYRNMDLGYY